MALRTKFALLTVLAMLLWAPAVAASGDDAGSIGGNDLVAQDTDDEDDDNGTTDDDNGTTDDDDDGTDDDGTGTDEDTEEPGVPAAGAGGAAAAGGTSIMLLAGLIAFLSATAAGTFAYLRRS